MPLATLLIVEPQAATESALCFHARRAGYEVVVAQTLLQAISWTDSLLPDLVIISWRPEWGVTSDFAPLVRTDLLTRHLPLLNLVPPETPGACRRDSDIDVSMSKTLPVATILAACDRLVRAGRGQALRYLKDGEVRVDLQAGSVQAGGQTLPLGRTEVRLLTALMRNPGETVPRIQLIERVWGIEADVEERTVDVLVSRVRRCLDLHGLSHRLVTVRGAGYCYQPM